MAISPERKMDRYLDSPCTRRQVLNAFEQLMEAHVEQYHTTAYTRALRKVVMAARKFGFRIRQARNA